MEQHKKLAKYLKGTAKALVALAKEIEEDGSFSRESEELMSEIGAQMLFHAKSYTFLDPPSPNLK